MYLRILSASYEIIDFYYCYRTFDILVTIDYYQIVDNDLINQSIFSFDRYHRYF